MKPRYELSDEQRAKRERLKAEARARAREGRGELASKNDLARHNAQKSAIKAQQSHAVAEQAKAAGMKKRQVRAADGSIQEVWSFDASYHAMGFQDHQIKAAERFNEDWEVAYSPLKGQGYEPSVDGGRNPHGPHSARVAAQDRLRRCKAALGARDWEIVVAVVIHGATARQIHKIGGHDHRTVKQNMDSTFNKLDSFYHGSERRDRTWRAFSKFNEDRAAALERAQ